MGQNILITKTKINISFAHDNDYFKTYFSYHLVYMHQLTEETQ